MCNIISTARRLTIECRRLVVMGLLCLNAATAVGVVVSDPEQNNDVEPGQSSYGLNLDGVALIGYDTPDSSVIEDVISSCSGALITKYHVLTVAHCLDENYDGQTDSPIRNFPFVAAFELPDRDVLIQVNTDTIHYPSAWPDENIDIAILELIEAAPPEIPRYHLYGGNDEVSKRVVLVGYGSTGFGDTGIDPVLSEQSVKRAGLNRYDDIRDDFFPAYDFDSGLQENNTLSLIGFESDLGFGRDEVFTAEGDSGGPTFIGEALAGVHSYVANLEESDVDDVRNSSWGEVGFDVRVSSFQDFILTATNDQAVFVPEPITPLPIVVIGVLASAVRRRRNLI